MTQRCATVAIVGRPNVGKSTLLNACVGAGLSAVSPKAQTTRQQVIGVWTQDDTQLVFLDTPGQAPEKNQTLNRLLDRNAVAALADVDIVLWVLEAGRRIGADQTVAERLVARQPKCLAIALNKVDKHSDKTRLFPELAALQKDYDPALLFPMSARREADAARLCEELTKLAPEGSWLYAADTLTPHRGEFLMAEKIREQLFLGLHQELPYRLAVTIDQTQEEGATLIAYATIWMDRASHKPIILGRGGQQLRRVREAAEADLSRLWDRPVRLHLWLKLREGWAEDQAVIRTLGASD